MATSLSKEVITKAIQEVIAEGSKTVIVGNPSQTAQDIMGDPDIDSTAKKTAVDTIKKGKKGDKVDVPTKSMEEETISVGHVDDEPGMLKQYAFDTAEYAVKLYKLLRHYEQMEGQVDFPNWWQQKVMMAREYMSKATHYLEFETVEPEIDAHIDNAPPEVDLEEIKQGDFAKIKTGTKIGLKGFGYVTVVDNDGIVLKVRDQFGKIFPINLGQYNEKVLQEAKATCCGRCGQIHEKKGKCTRKVLPAADKCKL